MEIYKKITKKTTDKELKELLGSLVYDNINNLYNRLKSDEINSCFYKDYLSDNKLDKFFVAELLENEDHIDFNKPITEEDYEELLSNINEGYLNSELTILHIGKLTDSYIGDGIINY